MIPNLTQNFIHQQIQTFRNIRVCSKLDKNLILGFGMQTKFLPTIIFWNLESVFRWKKNYLCNDEHFSRTVCGRWVPFVSLEGAEKN